MSNMRDHLLNTRLRGDRSLMSARSRWFAYSDDPDILVAQYANLKRQVPLLYLLLIITALAAFYTFVNSAPLALISSVTALMVSVGILRIAGWVWLSPSPEEITPDEVLSIMRRTTLAVVPICLVYVGYAFALDQYAGPYQQAGLAVCVVLTAIGCIFCLIHLPQAALLVHILTMVPYIIYHVYQGNPVFIMLAFNAAIVTTLLLRVSQNAFEGFTQLITSRAELGVQRGEAQRLAAENASLAMTDALTELPNRRLFFSRLEECVEKSAQSGQTFVVGALDLDRFKPVNDIYGHATGDQLLIQVAKRLLSLAGPSVLVARLGGDEFGLILSGDSAFANEIGDQVLDVLHRPFDIDGQDFSLGCSIGFASFPDAGRSASEVFDRADYALYEVKATQRGKHTFFTHDLETRLRAETEMETALLSADFDRELSVEFQPIVCLKTGEVIGIETLGRWESQLIGQVEPARFIEVAERLNIMSAITTTLFRELLENVAHLPDDLSLSFNLSTHDIVTSTTIDLLISAILDHGVSPERITFEITETALMRDYDVAIEHLERLRSLGARIALDDFGTGFSSLSYLNRLPIDKIKVDRSFVSNLTEPGVRKIVVAILGMCQTLEIECVVEGVETIEQCRHLMSLGCDRAQGFLFGRPMPIKVLKDWLGREVYPSLYAEIGLGLSKVPAFRELQEKYS